MNEKQLKRLAKVDLKESQFQQKGTTEERLANLEEQIERLTSYVNALGKTELVGDGTSEQPFNLSVGMDLVPNAYYNYEGVRYVYMGTSKSYNGEELTFDNGWAEF